MSLLLVLFFVLDCVAQPVSYVRRVIGGSESNREIIVEQYGDGADVIALLASIHGTEPAGTPLSIQFAAYISANPTILENKTILLIHVTNPDGVVEGIRGNRNNIDINRNFPTDNFGRGIFNGEEPVSAIETQVLLDFLEEYQPDRLLVFHQPVNCIDFDGNSEALAKHMSDVSGMRIKRLGSRSGSLGTYIAYKLEKEIITLELPSYASGKEAEWLWTNYGALLIAFVEFPFEK